MNIVMDPGGPSDDELRRTLYAGAGMRHPGDQAVTPGITVNERVLLWLALVPVQAG